VAAPAGRTSVSLAARVLFALLVAASVGAFFVTTRLKRSTPVVQRLEFSRYVSPNGDGRKDFATIRFRTKKEDEVTVTILDHEGGEIRSLATDRTLRAGPHRFRWNGRAAGGAIAPDGEYRLRIGLRKQGRSVTSPRKMFVDTTPPRPVVRYVSPDLFSPQAVPRRAARLRFDGPTRTAPKLLVYRTNERGAAAETAARPRLVARRTGRRGSDMLSWDGRTGLDTGQEKQRDPAPSGNYIMVVRVRDAAGNEGPVGLPRRGRLPGHPGIVVSYLAALGPLGPVRAGDQARFTVESGGRRYRWSVRRLGATRSLDRGSARSRQLRVRAPRGRTGAYLLQLRVGSHRYRIPFAVQGRRRGRVLLVLPVAMWQARNPLDSSGDGFADVLGPEPRVPLRRPFAGSGMPADFTAREAPLLLSLDRDRRRYDITTDLALPGGSTRPPVSYGGVLVAGLPRFFPVRTGRVLRSYVRAGGRLGWLGVGGFTEPLRVGANGLELVRRKPTRRNLLGERVRRAPAGSLTVLGDRIDFFQGVGDAFGPFPGLEETARLPADARLLASAGSGLTGTAGRPALVVYRYGRGVVARIGVDGFARASAAGGDPARIMRRLWTLLAR
jgi:hypothetical protein